MNVTEWFPRPPIAPAPRSSLMPFFRQEYLRIMRGRLAKLIWAIIDERSRRTLDLFASKPIDPGDYFTVKVAAAGAALATFYAGGVAGALAVFPWHVARFDPGHFLLLSAVHVFAALFGVAFAATMAVIVRHKLTSVLVSLVVALTALAGARVERRDVA
jgi:ABC-type transport system involved in multi-copper enzyme maturation permease subunit